MPEEEDSVQQDSDAPYVTNQYHLRQSDPYRESSPRLYECVLARQAPSMYKASRSVRGGRSRQTGSFSPSIIDTLCHQYVTCYLRRQESAYLRSWDLEGTMKFACRRGNIRKVPGSCTP